MMRNAPLAGGLESQATHLEPDLIDLLAVLAAGGEEAGAPEETAHLEQCSSCRARLEEAAARHRSDRDDLAELADTAFTESALDGQRQSILARLAAQRSNARVLVFPRRDPQAPRRDRPAARWLAAAAAAGLFVGMLAGQRLNPVLPLFGLSHESAPRVSSHSGGGLRSRELGSAAPVLVQAADEAFLSEMETALNNRGAAELRALDGLTPDPVFGRSGR